MIAGATGLVGSYLVRNLIDSPDYAKVISLGRRGLGWSHPKLTQIPVDFAALQALPADLRVDDAFCTLGTTIKKAGSPEAFRQVDYVATLELARACLARGARTFAVVTALGADPRSRFLYSRVKGELEQALRGLRFPSLIVLRPSLILGPRPEHRWAETLAEVVLVILGPVLIGPWRRYRAVDAAAIARRMVAAAQTPKPGTTIVESDEIP